VYGIEGEKSGEVMFDLGKHVYKDILDYMIRISFIIKIYIIHFEL